MVDNYLCALIPHQPETMPFRGREYMSHTKLGARIKSLREERGLDRGEMAERSGLNHELITAVEQGETAPAVGPMVKIARTLGCRLGTLLDDVQSKDPHIVRRQDREQEFKLQLATGGDANQTCYSLGKGKADRHMEPLYIELTPQQGEPEFSSHEGEEVIIVVQGRVQLRYGKEVHELEAGDSMYYNSIVPHHVGSADDGTAAIFAVIYAPF